MSDPPTTSSDPTHHHHHHHHHHQQQQQQQMLHLPIQAHNISRSTTMNAAATSSIREYRKGNWTLQETMILISAKKQDDERRSKANLTPSSSSSISADPTVRKAVGGELRWKWVENYCWTHGCQRSQNQCNDKWDNLLRDYKKIREFQSREEDHESSFSSSSSSSYWKMEKHERKDKNLPSNMPFEVFQALNDVVQRKYLHRTPPPPPPPPPGLPPSSVVPMLPPPPETTPTATTSPALSESSSGTESSEKQNMESKRRKVRDVNSSIERSTSMLAHTLRSCEEKREIRHQQLMELQRRSLQIEESRNQLHRQGIADLVTAVSGLSAGINNNNMSRTSREGEGYGCLYSGEEVRVLKEQNEAMQAEMITIKNELSQLKDQMPNLMQNMMHNMIHTMQNPPNSSTSLSQPHHHSMDPSGPGGDA